MTVSTAGPRRRRRTVLIVVAAVLVLLAAWTAWVGIRSLLAKDELERALPLAEQVREQLATGETAAAAGSLDELAAHATSAAQLTSDSVSRLAHAIPFAGPNLRALATVAAVVDDIASEGIAPVLPLVDSLDVATPAPVDGRLDLAPLVTAAGPLEQSAMVLARARDDVAGIDTSGTIAPVGDAVGRLSDAVDDASSALDTAATAARLVPAMLGADGDRDYLLLFQNNAELRATGGLPGALALVSTSDGRVEIGVQTAASAFPHYPAPVLPVERAALSLGGPELARYMQNVNLGREFPTAARFAAEMWRLEYGTELDGVIAVGPVFLGYLLLATGPIALETGDVIDSTTAVPFLLSDVYARYPDPVQQDLVFAAAARQVFSAVTSGDLDSVRALEAFARGAAERRVLVYNSREEEQELLSGTPFAGSLTDSDDSADVIGVYLNDATGAKMDYYLEASSAVRAESCPGESSWRTEVTLASTAPDDATTALPDYVTGGGFAGTPPGVIRTKVSVYGPAGSIVESVERDGVVVPAQVEQHHARGVVQVIVAPPPPPPRARRVS